MTAAKCVEAIATHLGMKGRRGGWIYDLSGKPVAQGWLACELLWQRNGWIRRHPDARVGGHIIDWRKVPDAVIDRR